MNRPQAAMQESTGAIDRRLPSRRLVVAIAGAGGYIGSRLRQELSDSADLVGLGRHVDPEESQPGMEWRRCDFFSREDALHALQGVDVAIYLIHSMMPSAKLTQGSFEDMDALLAEHFASAAAACGVTQIIYLSGIIPPGVPHDELSRHLRSRLEVEKILGSFGVPLTAVRAGLIVGPEGSSYPILSKLVTRLPIMVLPSWTTTKTHPIALQDAVAILKDCIGNPEAAGQVVDIGGPDVLSYRELLQQTASLMGKKRLMIPFPFPTVKLSRLWVSLVAGAPKEITYPLVESLAHPMVARAGHQLSGLGAAPTGYRAAAKQALDEEENKRRKSETQQSGGSSPVKQVMRNLVADVRSVQRFELPPGKDAVWAASRYFDWLGKSGLGLIRTERSSEGEWRIYAAGFSKPLLQLSSSGAGSMPYYVSFLITGGLLAKTEEGRRGRLIFLMLPHSRECLAAIHDFTPSLPWFFYKYTQAKVHLLVMYAFGKHLKKWRKDH